MIERGENKEVSILNNVTDLNFFFVKLRFTNFNIFTIM